MRLNETFQLNLTDREVLYNIKCPACGNTMRLRQDKLVKIKCTKCKYPFVVDNTLIETPVESESTQKEEPVKKTFARKLKESSPSFGNKNILSSIKYSGWKEPFLLDASPAESHKAHYHAIFS